MNKSEMLDRVAEAAGVGRSQAEKVLDSFFDTVKAAVKKGDRVAWPSFGAFSITHRKARTGRNPRTGDAVKIRASKAVKFSSSSALKDHMNSSGSAKAASSKKAVPTKKAVSSKKAAPAKSAAKSPARKAPAAKTAKAKKATKAGKATR